MQRIYGTYWVLFYTQKVAHRNKQIANNVN